MTNPDPKAAPATEWPLTAEQIVECEKAANAIMLTDGFKALAYPKLIALIKERDATIAAQAKEIERLKIKLGLTGGGL